MFGHVTCNVVHPRWEWYTEASDEGKVPTKGEQYKWYMAEHLTVNLLPYHYHMTNMYTCNTCIDPCIIAFIVLVYNIIVTWVAAWHTKYLDGIMWSIRAENVLFVWNVELVCNNIIVTRLAMCYAKLLCDHVVHFPSIRADNVYNDITTI